MVAFLWWRFWVLCGLLLSSIQRVTATTTSTATDESLPKDLASTAHNHHRSLKQFLDTTNYTHHVYLGTDEKKNVALMWTIDLEMEEIHLGIAVEESSSSSEMIGWIGFGISEGGGMKGADIVVYETSRPTELHDYYSMDYIPPTLDTCPSDWIFVSSSSLAGNDEDANANATDTVTITPPSNTGSVERQQPTTSESSSNFNSFLAFQAIRKLNTHDNQDWIFKNDSQWDVQPTRVIVAWGDQDTMTYHGNNRVSSTVRFFAEPTATASTAAVDANKEDDDSDTSKTTAASLDEEEVSNLQHLQQISSGSFVVTANNYSIPTTETTYYDFCIDLQDIPNYPANSESETIYVVGIAFASSLEINGVDTYEYVHHFSAFGNSKPCQKGDEGDASGGGYEPQNIFYGWGPGQQPLILPDDVGIAIGGDNSPIQSLALQIHYNNPNGVDGLIDSTGIEIFYTLEKPKYEAGIMVVGDGNLGLIGQPVGIGGAGGGSSGSGGDGGVLHRFTCPSSCTASHLSSNNDNDDGGGSGGGVTVFAEALHQHETGQRSVNQVIRNNSRVVHQASVEVWDYPHGGIKIVQQEPYQLYPGDVFRTYCYYGNNNNNNPSDTYFGLGTQDEMCQAMLWYYPATTSSTSSSTQQQGRGLFCGVHWSSAFATDDDDTTCDAIHVQTEAEPTFDRVFGSENKNGCNAAKDDAGMESSSAAPTIFLDGATTPTMAPTYFSGNPVCYVCGGEDWFMTKPHANLTVPGGARPCSQIRDAGLDGYIKASLCSTTQIVVSTACGCSNDPADLLLLEEAVAAENGNDEANDSQQDVNTSKGVSINQVSTVLTALTFASVISLLLLAGD